MFKNSLYSEFIYKSRYARYLEKEGRREEWYETVKRYFDFIQEGLKEKHNFDISSYRKELEKAVLCHEIMPSMRGLMSAGPAAKSNEIALYNCVFLPIDNVKSFDEEMAILMSGTGVGFSVESHNIKNLPEIPEDFFESETIIIFNDSRLGWAKGYREFISLLLIGQIPKWDVSNLRPAGARLKTMGGTSSGPEPLVDLLNFTINIFKKAAGRKLNSLEIHDIACKIGDIVVSGGVRRSALISLSDLNDIKMRDAKSGNWWQTNPYRRLSNNSAVYEEKPDISTFMTEWLSLYNSHSGERGIISREAIRNVIENSNFYRTNRINIPGYEIRTRDKNYDWGVNPCCEIILRPYEFCNLTSVQIYEDDTPETLKRKIRLATILGTFQSCFTNFRYLNKKYKKNCDDERLLGVSLNGIFDNKYTNKKYFLEEYEEFSQSKFYNFLESLKSEAIETNIKLAKDIGINSSVAITCVKPEGCVSLDTKIKTKNGILNMAEIFSELTSENIFEIGNGVWIEPENIITVYDENNNEKNITKLFVNGLSPVYEIEFEDGVIVKLTKNHQLKTKNGYKKAKDLSENDEIIAW